MPNAANQIWPHLKSDEPPKQQGGAQSLSASMYPALTPQAKARDEQRQRNKQNLRQALQEATARLQSKGGR